MRKKRTIVWLAPCPGCFQVAFILGEKAMQAARQTKWSKRIVKVMDEAPKYPEGTGIRLNVKSSRDIPTLKKLAAIKLAN
jgi:phosphomevalonate kinase